MFIIASIVCSVFMTVNGYVSKCVEPGMKCANCEDVIHCVGQPNGIITPIKILTCNNSQQQYCSIEGGGCVSDSKACYKFGLETIQCKTAGSFPDPYDCNSYHVCSENNGVLVSTRYKCPDERAFDALTATCRLKANHEVCKKFPVPVCVKPLQTEPLSQNPNIYFVCVAKDGVLKHVFYRCQAGHEFSKDMCAEVGRFRCTAEGQYKDDKNCRKYYHCRKDLTYVHRACRPGSHFDAAANACTKGSCS